MRCFFNTSNKEKYFRVDIRGETLKIFCREKQRPAKNLNMNENSVDIISVNHNYHNKTNSTLQSVIRLLHTVCLRESVYFDADIHIFT